MTQQRAVIAIKTSDELKIMRESGLIAAHALQKVLASVRVGITTLDLDNIAEEVIAKAGAMASFKTVDNYKYATCINVNDGVVHGMPNDYVLQRGDLVSVDLGAFYNGFHSDLSYTVEVETDEEGEFLQVGKNSLQNAISKATVGNTLGDISHAMQKTVEDAGYSVSRDLVGHGIGKQLHEEPYVPCYGQARKGPELKEGMVFAIEIIYQKGKPDLVLDEDEWTLSTFDRSLAGLFEHTVAISEGGPQILTSL